MAPHQLTRTDPDRVTLRDLRTWAGYTQGERGRRAGMSVSRYASVEQGRIKGRDEAATNRALARALDTNVTTIRAALKRTRAAAPPPPRRRRAPDPRVRLAGLGRQRLERYGAVLSLGDVADLLGVHLRTAERYVRDGLIPAHAIPGARRHYIFKGELLEALRTDGERSRGNQAR